MFIIHSLSTFDFKYSYNMSENLLTARVCRNAHMKEYLLARLSKTQISKSCKVTRGFAMLISCEAKVVLAS